MAAINDLINQIQDPILRNRIEEEVNKMAKQKKFGLVFEEHLPESTPLYDMPIKRGCNVMLRDNKDDKSIYSVLKLDGDTAICVKREQKEEVVTFALSDIVRVAEFGESIYPYLKPLDSICNAPDSDLWHTLIEADNYHALQLLEYLYAGKVDCIYIDPPYNTGAKDWKYNNDYVDSSDAYRHSKWLSMMDKRLKLAKKLLNPTDSVLIITIDEKEYLHLGCLLEEIFSDASIQMLSDVINPHGANRKNMFARVEEYIYFVFIGEASIAHTDNDMLHPVEKREVPWSQLIRCGASGTRSARPNQFYPVFFETETGKFHSIGQALPLGKDRTTVEVPNGCFAVFPINGNTGNESCWGLYPESFMEKYEKGYLKFGPYKKGSNNRAIKHLQSGMIKKIEDGDIPIAGYDDEGGIICGDADITIRTLSVWNQSSHDAGKQGSDMLQKIFIGNRFSFPKSVYATMDAINFAVKNKPNALILDFFAGSGTTLHAVNILNALDGGKRRCVLVTNNEVSEIESKRLSQKGFKPGDKEWDDVGIARYVTWPRTVCTIKGCDIKGNCLKGNYLNTDISMADGFRTNAAFFQLKFADKTAIELGLQFEEMLPVFWMKAGAIGKCPELVDGQIPDMLILPENKFAVLINEQAFSAFRESLTEYPEIQTVFLVTDYEANYQSMVKNIDVEHSYQLYRDYIDHFRLNRGRS